MSEEKKPVESLDPKTDEQKDASGQYRCGMTTTATCHYNNYHTGGGHCGGQTTSVCKTDVSY